MPQPDFTQDMISFLDNSFQEINNNAAEHSKKYSGASLLDPNIINQYRYQKDFNPMSFNPFDKGNHDRWVAKETWGTALAKGFDGFATRFGNTFIDYWKDYGRMVDALIHWDMSKMLPSESEMYAQHYKDQQDMFKNKVFVPYGEEDGIFNKAGISEFVSNAGFAMGTYSAFATELLVDTVITVLTAGGGAGTFGATVAKAGTKLGLKAGTKLGLKSGAKSGLKSGAKLGLNYIDDFFKGAFKVGHMDDIARVTTKAAGEVDNMAKAGKNLTNMSNASKAVIGDAFDMMTFNVKNILKSKSAGEFFLNAAKGVPVIGSGVRQAERIVKAGKAGYSIATMAGMGVRGVQRMANEFNMASTEATFEAISAYGETLDFMLKDYHNRHREGPNGLDFSLMQDKALKSATANYQTNMVILLATNKIQFGTLFNKFPMHKSWLTRQIINEAGEGIIGVTGKKGVLKVFDTKKFLGGIKTVAKIGKEFGWKKASWEAAKLFRKDFLKFEVTEGVQEILQESSNIAWKNYYAAQYTGAEKTITDAFGEGLGEQWSKQGLKVFIHGAMTGGLISMPTRIIGATLEQSQKYANDRQYGKENNPIRQAEAQRKRDIKTVNTAAWTADYNKSSVSQLVNTLKSSIHMDEAVKANNEFEWNNGKDNMMIQAAIAANRLGIDHAYTRAIEHMADDMTVDEFNKVMGIKLEDTKYKTPQEYAKSIAKQVGLYSETVTKVRKEFENLIDPMAFAPESMNQYAAMITRAKQEEAIEMIAMMRIKGDRNTDRIKSLKEEISKLPGLESSSQYAFNILTSVKGSKSELGEIQNRILTIKESLKLQTLTASEKAKYEEQLKDLQEREADIKTWQSFFTTNSEGQEVFIGETITEEETGKVLQHDTESKKVKDLFRKIINSKNKEDGLSEISEKAFQESSIKLSDIIKLTNQTKSLMDSYNSLYNAEKFQEVVKRMHEGHIKFIVSNNLEYYIQVMDRNILRYLAKKYNISESELAKERELIAGTNYNLNPNEQMNYMFQLATIYQLMEKNPQMKEDYKNFREQLNLQLENNKAYQELLSLVVDPSKFEEDIKKIESLMKQVGDVIIAFDVKVLSETDPTFAKQDISPDITVDTITSDDIIRIAAKLNKDMELAPNEAKLYEDEKVKELVDKQREKLKEADIEIKDDNPNVIEEEELKDTVDEIISDEEYDKFVDSNEVSDFILQNIASKIIEGKELSDREMAIFTERTSDIEAFIQKLDSIPNIEQSDIEAKKADIERRKRDTVILENRKRLNLDGEIKLNFSEDVYSAFDDLDNKIPVTNDRLQNAVNELYRAYKRMYATMKSDTRQHTISELQNMADYLESELETLTQIIYEQEKEGKFIHEIETSTTTKEEQRTDNQEIQFKLSYQLALPLPRQVIEENNKTEKITKQEEQIIAEDIKSELESTNTREIEIFIEDDVENILDKLDNSIPVINEDIRYAINKLYNEYRRLNKLFHTDIRINKDNLAEMIFFLEQELNRLHFILDYQTALGRFHKAPTGRKPELKKINKTEQDSKLNKKSKVKKEKQPKIQKKESNVEPIVTKTKEELNAEYIRKKADDLLEELMINEDFMNMVDINVPVSIISYNLQLIIAEKLSNKYPGRLFNTLDGRSKTTINKIIAEIKQDFINSMPQEPVVIETKDIPDSDVINMNVLTIEGIKQEVEQNTVSLVEKTEKILDNSKKSSNFVATEETILNVLKEIKNFKC